jgi:O-antigen/teichoic acid export membrane protein
MGGRLIDFSISVAVALVYQDVWALVAGLIVMNVTKLIVSYLINDYRPSISFTREYAEEMFSFGKWMFASAILVFLYSQGDDAFVGWFFSATALGFYQLAYRLSNAPATEVTHVVSRVAFPTFSKVQDDPEKLRSGFLQATHISTMVAFPMGFGIIVVSDQFVHSVLGNQWEPMVPLLQILALWGILRSFGANFGAVFKAVGRPDYEVGIHTLKVALIVVLIYPAAEYFGIIGVGAVIVGTTLIEQPIALSIILSITGSDFRDIILEVIYPLVGSLGMSFLVIGLDRHLFSDTGMVELAIMVTVGVVSYATIMTFVENRTSYEFWETVKQLTQTI